MSPFKKKRGGRKCKRYVIERVETLIFNLESRALKHPLLCPEMCSSAGLRNKSRVLFLCCFFFLMMESSALDVGDTAVFTVVQTAQEPSIKYYGRPLGGRPLCLDRGRLLLLWIHCTVE